MYAPPRVARVGRFVQAVCLGLTLSVSLTVFAPACHAQSTDLKQIEAKIKELEVDEAQLKETLEVWEDMASKLERKEYFVLPMVGGAGGGFYAPMPKTVVEGYIRARLLNETLTPEGVPAFIREYGEKTKALTQVARQQAQETEQALRKTKDQLSYYLNERIRLREAKAPQGDLSGRWLVTEQNPWDTNEIRWVLSPEGTGRWKVARTLLKTTNASHVPFVGKEEAGGRMVAEGPGKFRYTREGGDPNPANPGHYSQEGTGTYDANTFAIDATHQGSQNTFKFTLKGTREK